MTELLIDNISEDDEIWIFGYGSLVWKNNDFEYESSEPGSIKGYHRRFYQNSIDHRGTVENPGRVVTLIKSPNTDDTVYGMGFKLIRGKIKETLDYLDVREINGYERHTATFHPLNSSGSKSAVFYCATEENPSWSDQHDISAIADQIIGATGISGRNVDYVFNLCKSMRELFPGKQDDHLFELENVLIQKMKSKE